jgi:hypothetical protein
MGPRMYPLCNRIVQNLVKNPHLSMKRQQQGRSGEAKLEDGYFKKFLWVNNILTLKLVTEFLKICKDLKKKMAR